MRICVTFLVGLLLSSVSWALSSVERYGDIYYPAVGGGVIVWQEVDGAPGNIYGYDTVTEQLLTICDDSNGDNVPQLNPAISEDGRYVAWMDGRPSGPGLWVLDRQTNIETRVFNFYYPPLKFAISGDLVIWLGDNGMGQPAIVGYDMSAQLPLVIHSAEHVQNDLEISGDIIVWSDTRNSTVDVYGYNLATQTELAICTDDSSEQNGPKICGDLIVWQDTRAHSDQVYGYDLTTQQEIIIENVNSPLGTIPYPKLMEGFLCWQYGGQMKAYDLRSKRLLEWNYNGPSYDYLPACDGNIMVWLADKDYDGELEITYASLLRLEDSEYEISVRDINAQIDLTSRDGQLFWLDNYELNIYGSANHVQSVIGQPDHDFPAESVQNGYYAAWADVSSMPYVIQVYNIGADTTTAVVTDASSPGYPPYVMLGDEKMLFWSEQVSVSGNPPEFYVYAYDLDTQVKTTVHYSSSPLEIEQPEPIATSDSFVVWRSFGNSAAVVYVGDLSGGSKYALNNFEPFYAGWRLDVDCEGDLLVWSENDDILGYNMASHTAMDIEVVPGVQRHPIIDGSRVFWYNELSSPIFEIRGRDLATSQDIVTGAEQYGPYRDFVVRGDNLFWCAYINSDFIIKGLDLRVNTQSFLFEPGMGQIDRPGPKIDGCHIVYLEQGELKVLDINTGVSIVIAQTNGSYPYLQYDISGNRVVWSDYGMQGMDIFMYDLSSATQTTICDDELEQMAPSIDGYKVVWLSQTNSGNQTLVYVYDVLAQQKTLVRTLPYGLTPDRVYTETEGDWTVVYQNAIGPVDFYCYNTEDGREVHIDSDGYNKLYPDISGDIVVWQDTRGDERIMTYNLSTGDEGVMTSDSYPSYERCPRISGDLVVCMNDDYRLNLSWLKGQLPIDICSDDVQTNNRWWGDIDGNVVCWMSQDYNLCWRELWCDMDRQPYGVRLDGSSCYRGSTFFAQGTDVSSCGVGDTADVWHSIHVDEKGWWNFEVETGMTNPIMSVFSHEGQELGCTSNTSLNLLLDADSDYQVRLAGESGSVGRYALFARDIDCVRPAGDVDGDCVVNLVDFALMASSWLECGLVDDNICP